MHIQAVLAVIAFVIFNVGVLPQYYTYYERIFLLNKNDADAQ